MSPTLLALLACSRGGDDFVTPAPAAEGGVTWPEQTIEDAGAASLLLEQLQVAGALAPALILEVYRAGDEGDCLDPLGDERSAVYRDDCTVTGPDTALDLRGFWELTMSGDCGGGDTLSLDAAVTLEGSLGAQSVDTTLDLEYAYELGADEGWWEWSGSLAPSDLPESLDEALRASTEGRLFQGAAVRWDYGPEGVVLSGLFADQGAGASAVSTPSPLIFAEDCGWPVAGELLFEAGTEALLTFEQGGYCELPTLYIDDRAAGPIEPVFHPPEPLCL